jgi:hypothetical protein
VEHALDRLDHELVYLVVAGLLQAGEELLERPLSP